MLEQAWESYRGWAARARQSKTVTRYWAWLGFGAAAAAAIFGTLSAQHPGSSRLLAVLSMLAALAAALSGWLGRESVQRESQSQWLTARSIAEAIKSECYRYAARIAPYDVAAGDAAFIRKIGDIEAAADDLGLSPVAVEPLADTSARPTRDIDAAWYAAKRLADQNKHFQRVQRENVRRVRLLQLLSLAVMLLAAAGGALTAATNVPLAGWIGVMTTIAASIGALGLAERSRGMAIDAAKVINRLNRLQRLQASDITLAEFVGSGETLLLDENARWLTMMSKHPQPANAPAATNETTP